MDYFIVFCLQAKLPRGIENIRPHLRSTDNVPLLVNLFTDCTVESKSLIDFSHTDSRIGPEVVKLFPYSAQLSRKFTLFVNI